jgi:hypothetical protein
MVFSTNYKVRNAKNIYYSAIQGNNQEIGNFKKMSCAQDKNCFDIFV